MNEPQYPKHSEVLSRLECPKCHGAKLVPIPSTTGGRTGCDRCDGLGWIPGPEPEAALTLRDRFAMAALTGITADGGDGSVEGSVRLAYDIADAMMRRRAEP